MKIAYLSNSTIPSTAANSVHVMKMCAAFVRQGHSVDLYAAKTISKEHNVDPFRYYGIKNAFTIIKSVKPSFRGGGMIFRLVGIYKMLFRKYDLIYARNYLHAKLTLLFNKPLLIEVHDIPKYGKEIRAIKTIIHSDRLICLVTISHALKDEYLRLYPELNNKKVVVAHDCADVPQETAKNNDNSEIAIGYVGHLYEGRGIEVIFEMAKRFANRTFYIVGGSAKDINRLKSSCNINNIVFEGFVPNGELYRYYSKFDIVLAPYQKRVSVSGNSGDTSKYMSPLKLFEYMAYKKAIISSDIPVLREVLTDNENSLLCECDNLDEWERAIDKLIRDNNFRQKLVEAAHEDFLKNYTWDERAKRLLGVL